MSTPDGYEQLSLFLRALAHPVRLQILDVLARQEACVCHLTAVLGRPQPYISQQLAILRQAGLVDDRREGALVYYCIADLRVDALLELSKVLLPGVEQGEVVFPAIPETLPACPCPRCMGGATVS